MSLLGLLRGKRRAKANSDVGAAVAPSTWRTVLGGRIDEPFAGAWQQNKEITASDGLKYPVVFACISRISEDVSKVPLRIERRDSHGIYKADRNHALTKLLRQPNDYQDRQQFLASWEASVQSRGNAYILKGRGPGGQVNSLHVLHPDLTQPLVTPKGAVFYQLNQDNLAGIEQGEIVPADEIIHDRINCFFHPLVGLSPLYAAAMNIWLGVATHDQQQQLFTNGATPGGILIFPGALDEESAAKIRDSWNKRYSGDGKGGTAVMGDGVKYEKLSSIAAQDGQLIEQLRFGAVLICSVFKVPPYKVYIEPVPSINDIEGFNQLYFSDCLQSRMVAIQSILEKAFGLEGSDLSFRFDLDALILMDSKTRTTVAVDMRKGGVAKIDEARKRLNLPPLEGGDDIYMQQQDHSLSAIAERDRRFLDGINEPEPVNIDIAELSKSFKKGLTNE